MEWGINNTKVEENGKPFWNPQLVTNLIKWIHRNKSSGAILCFVSGWQDILDVINLFNYYIFILNNFSTTNCLNR